MTNHLLIAVVATTILLTHFVAQVDAARRSRKQAPKVHPEGGLVREATSSTFRDLVLDPTVPVMVAVYDTTNDKATETLSKSIEICAKELESIVEFVYVDGSSDDGKQLLQGFGISQVPVVLFFNPELVPVPGGQEGQLMKVPLGYEGDGSASSITRFILNSISLNHIERVKDDHDLADFFGKFGGLEMPRILYVTDASTISPIYIALSHRHRYGAVFGVAFANNSAEVKARYSITTTPTILALTPSGSRDDTVAVMPNLHKESTMDDINDFIAAHALPVERQTAIRPSIYAEEERLRQKEADHAKMVRALPVAVIRTKKDWVRLCLTRKKGFCIALFVDGLGDDDNNLPLGMLMNVSLKIATKSSQEVQIVVVDGLQNYEIVNHLGMQNGLPDVVVINAPKRTYTNFVGSVTERGITNFFLDKAQKASGKAFKAKKVPKFVVTRKVQSEDDDEISDEL